MGFDPFFIRVRARDKLEKPVFVDGVLIPSSSGSARAGRTRRTTCRIASSPAKWAGG